MKGRSFLVYAISVSLVEQAILLVVLLLILPAAGIVVPVWGVILAVVILATVSVVLTRLNLRTLALKGSHSPDVGVHGRVVKALDPRGYVRIGNELWAAKSEGEPLTEGQEVKVLRMESLLLIVEEAGGPEEQG